MTTEAVRALRLTLEAMGAARQRSLELDRQFHMLLASHCGTQS